MIDKISIDAEIERLVAEAALPDQNPQYKEELLQLVEWLTELNVRRAIQMPPMYSIQPPTGGNWPPAQL